MKQNLLFIFLLFLCFTNYAQKKAPNIKWQNSLGGTKEEEGMCIQTTNDGGSIVAAYSSSHNGNVTNNYGSYDFWIVKLNEKGNITNAKNFGGTSSDMPSSIKQTYDGGYIIAGTSESHDIDLISNYGNNDGWIIKLDSAENIQWQKNCGGSNYDVLNEVIETYDSCYVVVGTTLSQDHDVINPYSGSECWVTKFSRYGDILWSKCFGKGNESGHSIQQTKDSGFIVLANSYTSKSDSTGHHGDDDCWVIKLNKKGTTEWSKYFGGRRGDDGSRIKQTSDDGYIFCALTYSDSGDVSGNHGNSDYWVVKLNAIGILEWQNCFGGSREDYPFDIIETTGNEYLVAGYANSNDGDVTYNHSVNVPDCWLLKLNGAGKLLWQKSYGGSASDIARSVVQTTDGGFLITGQTFSKDGDVIGYHGTIGGDAWTVKLYPDKKPTDPYIVSNAQKNEIDFSTSINTKNIYLFPNPAKDIITISGLNTTTKNKNFCN